MRIKKVKSVFIIIASLILTFCFSTRVLCEEIKYSELAVNTGTNAAYFGLDLSLKQSESEVANYYKKDSYSLENDDGAYALYMAQEQNDWRIAQGYFWSNFSDESVATFRNSEISSGKAGATYKEIFEAYSSVGSIPSEDRTDSMVVNARTKSIRLGSSDSYTVEFELNRNARQEDISLYAVTSDGEQKLENITLNQTGKSYSAVISSAQIPAGTKSIKIYAKATYNSYTAKLNIYSPESKYQEYQSLANFTAQKEEKTVEGEASVRVATPMFSVKNNLINTTALGASNVWTAWFDTFLKNADNAKSFDGSRKPIADKDLYGWDWAKVKKDEANVSVSVNVCMANDEDDWFYFSGDKKYLNDLKTPNISELRFVEVGRDGRLSDDEVAEQNDKREEAFGIGAAKYVYFAIDLRKDQDAGEGDFTAETIVDLECELSNFVAGKSIEFTVWRPQRVYDVKNNNTLKNASSKIYYYFFSAGEDHAYGFPNINYSVEENRTFPIFTNVQSYDMDKYEWNSEKDGDIRNNPGNYIYKYNEYVKDNKFQKYIDYTSSTADVKGTVNEPSLIKFVNEDEAKWTSAYKINSANIWAMDDQSINGLERNANGYYTITPTVTNGVGKFTLNDLILSGDMESGGNYDEKIIIVRVKVEDDINKTTEGSKEYYTSTLNAKVKNHRIKYIADGEETLGHLFQRNTTTGTRLPINTAGVTVKTKNSNNINMHQDDFDHFVTSSEDATENISVDMYIQKTWFGDNVETIDNEGKITKRTFGTPKDNTGEQYWTEKLNKDAATETEYRKNQPEKSTNKKGKLNKPAYVERGDYVEYEIVLTPSEKKNEKRYVNLEITLPHMDFAELSIKLGDTTYTGEAEIAKKDIAYKIDNNKIKLTNVPIGENSSERELWIKMKTGVDDNYNTKKASVKITKVKDKEKKAVENISKKKTSGDYYSAKRYNIPINAYISKVYRKDGKTSVGNTEWTEKLYSAATSADANYRYKSNGATKIFKYDSPARLEVGDVLQYKVTVWNTAHSSICGLDSLSRKGKPYHNPSKINELKIKVDISDLPVGADVKVYKSYNSTTNTYSNKVGEAKVTTENNAPLFITLTNFDANTSKEIYIKVETIGVTGTSCTGQYSLKASVESVINRNGCEGFNNANDKNPNEKYLSNGSCYSYAASADYFKFKQYNVPINTYISNVYRKDGTSLTDYTEWTEKLYSAATSANANYRYKSNGSPKTFKYDSPARPEVGDSIVYKVEVWNTAKTSICGADSLNRSESPYYNPSKIYADIKITKGNWPEGATMTAYKNAKCTTKIADENITGTNGKSITKIKNIEVSPDGSTAIYIKVETNGVTGTSCTGQYSLKASVESVINRNGCEGFNNATEHGKNPNEVYNSDGDKYSYLASADYFKFKQYNVPINTYISKVYREGGTNLTDYKEWTEKLYSSALSTNADFRYKSNNDDNVTKYDSPARPEVGDYIVYKAEVWNTVNNGIYYNTDNAINREKDPYYNPGKITVSIKVDKTDLPVNGKIFVYSDANCTKKITGNDDVYEVDVDPDSSETIYIKVETKDLNGVSQNGKYSLKTTVSSVKNINGKSVINKAGEKTNPNEVHNESGSKYLYTKSADYFKFKEYDVSIDTYISAVKNGAGTTINAANEKLVADATYNPGSGRIGKTDIEKGENPVLAEKGDTIIYVVKVTNNAPSSGLSSTQPVTVTLQCTPPKNCTITTYELVNGQNTNETALPADGKIPITGLASGTSKEIRIAVKTMSNTSTARRICTVKIDTVKNTNEKTVENSTEKLTTSSDYFLFKLYNVPIDVFITEVESRPNAQGEVMVNALGNTRANQTVDYKSTNPVLVEKGDTVEYTVKIINAAGNPSANYSTRPVTATISYTLPEGCTAKYGTETLVAGGTKNVTAGKEIKITIVTTENMTEILNKCEFKIDSITNANGVSGVTNQAANQAAKIADSDYFKFNEYEVSINTYISNVYYKNSNNEYKNKDNAGDEYWTERLFAGTGDYLELLRYQGNLTENSKKYNNPAYAEVGDKLQYRVELTNHSTSPIYATVKIDKSKLPEGASVEGIYSNATFTSQNGFTTDGNDIIVQMDANSSKSIYLKVVTSGVNATAQYSLKTTIDSVKNTNKMVVKNKAEDNNNYLEVYNDEGETYTHTVSADYFKFKQYSVSIDAYIANVTGSGIRADEMFVVNDEYKLGLRAAKEMKIKKDNPVLVEKGDKLEIIVKIINNPKPDDLSYTTRQAKVKIDNILPTGCIASSLPEYINVGEEIKVTLETSKDTPDSINECIFEIKNIVNANGETKITNKSDETVNADYFKFKQYNALIDAYIIGVTRKDGAPVGQNEKLADSSAYLPGMRAGKTPDAKKAKQVLAEKGDQIILEVSLINGADDREPYYSPRPVTASVKYNLPSGCKAWYGSTELAENGVLPEAALTALNAGENIRILIKTEGIDSKDIQNCVFAIQSIKNANGEVGITNNGAPRINSDYFQFKQYNVGIDTYIWKVEHVENRNGVGTTYDSEVRASNVNVNTGVGSQDETKAKNPVYVEYGDRVTYKVKVYNTTNDANYYVDRDKEPYHAPQKIWTDLVAQIPAKHSGLQVNGQDVTAVNNQIYIDNLEVQAGGVAEFVISFIVEDATNVHEVSINLEGAIQNINKVDVSNNSKRFAASDKYRLNDYNVTLEQYINAYDGAMAKYNNRNGFTSGESEGFLNKYNDYSTNPLDVEKYEQVTFATKITNVTNAGEEENNVGSYAKYKTRVRPSQVLVELDEGLKYTNHYAIWFNADGSEKGNVYFDRVGNIYTISNDNFILSPGEYVMIYTVAEVTASNMTLNNLKSHSQIVTLTNVNNYTTNQNEFSRKVTDQNTNGKKSDDDYIRLKDLVVAGRVWLEKDGKTALEGITVKLYGNNNPGRAFREVTSTTTNANGFYTLGRQWKAPKDASGKYTSTEYIKYYVEFEYNGSKYKATENYSNAANLSQTWRQGYENLPGPANGKTEYLTDSNAYEFRDVRDSFDKKFQTIGYNAGYNGTNKAADLEYTKNGTISTLNNTQAVKMTARSFIEKGANSSIDKTNTLFFGGYTETEYLKFINLGLIERDKVDLSIEASVASVKTAINGEEMTYTGLNNELKLYESDYKYRSSDYYNDNAVKAYKAATEQDVEVTYKVTMKNENSTSDGVEARIDELVIYYDSNFMEYKGTKKVAKKDDSGFLNSQEINVSKVSSGTVSDTAKYKNNENLDSRGYQKLYITGMNNYISKGENQELQITFTVKRDGDKLQLGDLGLIAEIGAYTTQKDGKYASLVDIDSNPGNLGLKNGVNQAGAGIEANGFYEDDTSKAEIKLTVPVGTDEPGNPVYPETPDSPLRRSISGFVWDDARSETVGTVDTGIQYLGNGVYNASDENHADAKTNPNPNVIHSNDKKVGGVKVSLVEIVQTGDGKYYEIPARNSAGNLITAVTEADGKYTLSDYIPGYYKVRFDYGFNKDDNNSIIYNGQDYKSTTYTDPEKTVELTNNIGSSENNFYYDVAKTKLNEANKSDARDDEIRRLNVNSYSETMTTAQAAVFAKPYNYTEALTQNTWMYAESAIFYAKPENVGSSQYNIDAAIANFDSARIWKIDSFDFGLEYRPEVSLILNKNIESILLITSDNKTLVELKFKDENGVKVIDEAASRGYQNVLFMGNTGKTQQGFAHINVDTAILTGAILKVNYKIDTQNYSEVDRISKNLYELREPANAIGSAIIVNGNYSANGTAAQYLANAYYAGYDFDAQDGTEKYSYLKQLKKSGAYYGKYLGSTYYTGEIGANDVVSQVRVDHILDYVDNDFTFNVSENKSWQLTTSNELEGMLDWTSVRHKDKKLLDKADVRYDTNKRSNLALSQLSDFLKSVKVDANDSTSSITATMTKMISADDVASGRSLTFENIAEIIQYTGLTGRRTMLPDNDGGGVIGNANVGYWSGYNNRYEDDTDVTEVITITPPTGLVE